MIAMTAYTDTEKRKKGRIKLSLLSIFDSTAEKSKAVPITKSGYEHLLTKCQIADISCD